MFDIILQQLVLCKAALWFGQKKSSEHLVYRLTLVSVVNNQLVKSEILMSKEKN